MTICLIGSHRRKLVRTIAVTILVAAPTVAKADDASEQEATRPWLSCLVESSKSLASSPDSSPVVVAAALALCRPMEGVVRLAIESSSREKLVRDGVVSNAAEALRVQRSIGDSGWVKYLAGMRDQLTAVVVQLRAKSQSR